MEKRGSNSTSMLPGSIEFVITMITPDSGERSHNPGKNGGKTNAAARQSEVNWGGSQNSLLQVKVRIGR